MASFRRNIAGSSNGNMKVWTYSVWFKRAKLGQLQFLLSWGENNSGECKCYIDSDDRLFFSNDSVNGSSNKPTRVLRDTNAWYHLVWRHKADEASNDDRWKIYLNGELIPASEYGSPTLANTDGYAQKYSVMDMWIGENARNQQGSGIYPFYGSMSHIHFCDGYAYDASSFGETDATTGEWKIKTSPSVSYGTYGFWIAKDGNSGTDQSPNSNNATVSGALTKTEDNPSNVFATLNPLVRTASTPSFSKGNNTVSPNAGTYQNHFSTIGMTGGGKYYWEMKVNGSPNSANYHGLSSDTELNNLINTANVVGYTSASYAFVASSGNKYNNSSSSSYGSALASGDIMMGALDLDNGKIWFGKNGTWFNSGNPASGSNEAFSSISASNTYFVSGTVYNGGFTSIDFNFGNGYFGTTAVSSAGTNASGNGIFEYDVPTGYTALSTKGLNL